MIEQRFITNNNCPIKSNGYKNTTLDWYNVVHNIRFVFFISFPMKQYDE